MTTLPNETTVTIGEITYRLSKFSLPLYQEFVAWAKTQLPDPFAGLADKVKGLPLELAKHLIDKAQETSLSRNTLDNPEINAVANSLPGVKKMVSLLFKKYQPSLSEDDVFKIVEQGIEERGTDFFSESFKLSPESSNQTS